MYKNKRVIVRMSDLDYATISKKAELLQMSVSEYMRTSSTGRTVKGYKAPDNAQQQEQEQQIAGQMDIKDLIPEDKPTKGKKGAKKA